MQTDKLVHAILDSGKKCESRKVWLRLKIGYTGKALWVPRIAKGDEVEVEVACAAESRGHQAQAGLPHKKGFHMDALRIYSLEDYQSLIPGLWGIREPPREYDGKPRLNGKSHLPACQYHPLLPTLLAVQDAESGGIDLVLVPGQILTGPCRVSVYSPIKQVSRLMHRSLDLVMGKGTMIDSYRTTLRSHQFGAGPCQSCVSHAPGIALTGSNDASI